MPSVDKTWMVDNANMVINAARLLQLANTVETYTFKHIPVTGVAGSENTVKVVPGIAGAQHIDIDGSAQSIAAKGNKAVPSFEAAANYDALGYVIRVIKEQEEDVHIVYDGTLPNVNGSSELVFKLYRGGIGAGYNGGSDAYCTLIIEKI